MNQQLTSQILLHIYRNLGIIFEVKGHSNISILSDKFIIKKNLSFDFDGENKIAKLWGAQISFDKVKFRILCGDFSSEFKEYAIVIKLDNCPTYGCYLTFDDYDGSGITDGFIVFLLKNNSWLMSNTYIQATFLAGMEQLRDIGASWDTLSKYDDLVENIKSLVEYHDSYFGDEEYEG